MQSTISFLGEVLFLAWGIRVCYNVRNAESLYNEARMISYAIYNIALVNILMICFQYAILTEFSFVSLICYCFSFSQFNHISTSRTGCQILPGLRSNAIIHNDDCCAGVWPESVASFAWARRSMGSSCSSSWNHRLVFTQRHWPRPGARRFARSVSRERRAKGNIRIEMKIVEFPLINIFIYRSYVHITLASFVQPIRI